MTSRIQIEDLDWETTEPAAAPVAAQATAPASAPSNSNGNGQRGAAPCLYLDLETAPDTERLELFGLPPVPEPRPMKTSAECPDPTIALGGTLDDVERRLTEWNPEDAYLDWVVATEGVAPKPRAGVKKLAEKIKSDRSGALEAEAERRKLLSVTPEYCRIVAVGWAIGGDAPESLVLDGATYSADAERALLDVVWGMIRKYSPIVGYNVLGFDLQVIRARSILLDVEPSKILNDSPFSNRDVCDLMLCRFGKGGKAMRLKQLARLYGVPVPAGDTDGSCVETLLANDPAALHQYVRSDVEITRALHLKWRGYFCV